LKPPKTVPIEALFEEPYASIVCYPRANPTEIQARIEELEQLGVLAVEFVGKTAASNIPVLGKGYVGVVVVAQVKGQRMALKMRRVDADRPDFSHEAEMLQRANSVEVGPKFFAASNNFLLSQLIEGDIIEVWLETQTDKNLLRNVLTDILEQCWRLDEIGLDHGELSKAPKHLLIDQTNKPFIVDFETASTNRNASNVTSVCQYLFQGNSDASGRIAELLGRSDSAKVVAALRKYRKEMVRSNFIELKKLFIQ